jgi:hypothetical protein
MVTTKSFLQEFDYQFILGAMQRHAHATHRVHTVYMYMYHSFSLATDY